MVESKEALSQPLQEDEDLLCPDTLPQEEVLVEQSEPEATPDSKPEPEATPIIEPETIQESSPEEVLEESPSQEDSSEAFLEAPIQYLSNGLVRIPVAQKGKFKHEAYGEVSFTDNDFEEIISNFQEDSLGFEPYVTFGHLVDPKLSVDAELKKGKPKEFEIDGDTLYAVTEPTSETLELIKKGEYEYSSGEFIRNYKDKITGENKGTVLLRYALTNSPFIPFKDKKIEVIESKEEELSIALSDSNRLHSLSNFMIKLSLDSKDLLDKKDISMQETEQLETAVESPVSENTPAAADSVAPIAAEAPAVTVPATPAPVAIAAEASSGLDVNKLLQQIGDSYKSQFEAFKQASEQTIVSLKNEVNNLSGRLEQQQTITQAFSNNISQAQKQARQNQLIDQGMPPVLVERLSQIQSALESGSQVIKLSTEAGTQDQAVNDSIAQLVMDALYAHPVEVEQYGQGVSRVAANGLTADIQRLVEANKASAAKATI